jgi:protein TonB
VSENRFLQSLCALVGAATLVCGTHLFLIVTSDRDSATLDIAPPPATATISIELSPGSEPVPPAAKRDGAAAPVAEQPASQSDVPQDRASAGEPPQIVAAARVGDQSPLVSASATTSVETATKDESPQSAAAVAPQQPKAASEDAEQPALTPIVAVEPKPEKPSPQVPLPQRAPRAAKEKPAPQPATKSEQQEQQSAQATQHRKPMGLAPADGPSIPLTQGQPKRLGAGDYSSKIWSALACKKSIAGERGSTTVTFAIGPAGALRFVRVSQSSGNVRLDQLALATVRNAAPFPPPPVLRDGTAAYTIRIDFH